MVIQPPDGSGTRGLSKPLDFVFDVVEVEQHARTGEQFDFGFRVRHGAAAIGARGLRSFAIVDQHARCQRIHFVAHGALDRIEIVIERGGRSRALPLRHDGPPGFGEPLGIFLQIRKRRIDRRTAQDVAGTGNERAIRFLDHRVAERGQPRAFRFVVDAPRQRDAGLIGHHHQQPSGDSHVRGKPRAFFADGILHHLHDDLFALMHAIADLGGALVVEAGKIGQAARFAGAQEARTIESDIDKSRLHAGQHPLHAPQYNVADQAVAAAPAAALAQWPVIQADGALEKEFLQPTVFDDGHTNLPCPGVDQDFLLHRMRSANSSATTLSRNRDTARLKKMHRLQKRQPNHIRPRAVQLPHESFGATLDRVAARLTDPLAASEIGIDFRRVESLERNARQHGPQLDRAVRRHHSNRGQHLMRPTGQQCEAGANVFLRFRLGQDSASAGNHRIRRKNDGSVTAPGHTRGVRLRARKPQRIETRLLVFVGRLVDGGRCDGVRDNSRLRQQRFAARAFARKNEERLI